MPAIVRGALCRPDGTPMDHWLTMELTAERELNLRDAARRGAAYEYARELLLAWRETSDPDLAPDPGPGEQDERPFRAQLVAHLDNLLIALDDSVMTFAEIEAETTNVNPEYQ